MEIYWSGTWGAISDSSWTAAEASVVCRQLQHSDYGTRTLSHFIFYHCDRVLSNQYQQFHKNISDYSKYSTLLSAFRYTSK